MKIGFRNFLFFSFVLIAFFTNRYLFAEVFWNLPLKEITTSGSDAKIATDSSGKYVYVVYSSDKLTIKVSNDYGQSFANTKEFDSSLNSSAKIITDASGQYIYVIWVEDKKVFQSVSSDHGKSFIDPLELDSQDFEITNPQITCDSSGENVYAIWEDYYGILQIRTSATFGTRWTDKIQIASGHNPQIACDKTGKYVYTVWDDDDVRAKVSNDFAKSFSKDMVLDSSADHPQLAISDDGKYVYAIWQDGSNNIQLRASEFGENWYPPLQFSSLGAFEIKLTTSKDGKYVYAIWNDDKKIHMIVSSDYGMGFETFDLNEQGSYPCIATDCTGKCVYLLWLDKNYDIQFRSSTDSGISFAPKLKLTSSSESTWTYPNITLNEDGEYFYILWSNLTSSSVKIVNGVDLLLSKVE